MENKDFIVGKWYKVNDREFYGKFLKMNNSNNFVSSEYYIKGYSSHIYEFCYYNNWRLATQLELDEILPKGHPDRFDTIKTIEYEIY